MTDDISPSAIQVHIHEHITPVRERISRLEGRLDVDEKEIGMLREGLEVLRERIDDTKTEVLQAIERTQREVNELSAGVSGLQGRVAAYGTGAMVVVLGLQLLAHLGVFK